MQLLTGVPMLHHLGHAMVRYSASSTDLPGFLWCGYDSNAFRWTTSSLGFCFAAFVILSGLLWFLPHLPIPSTLRVTLQNGVPWVSLSVSLNIIVTSMICFRLLRMRALLRQVVESEASRMYTNIAAMLVESAAPFTIIGIGFLITSIHDVPLSYAFGYVWNMFYVRFVPSPPAHTRFCE
jgi:hypothetical protein